MTTTIQIAEDIAKYQSGDTSIVDYMADSDAIFGDVESKPVYLHVWGVDRYVINTLSEAKYAGEIIVKLTGSDRSASQIVSDIAVMQLS